jgi:hypothetical protein
VITHYFNEDDNLDKVINVEWQVSNQRVQINNAKSPSSNNALNSMVLSESLETLEAIISNMVLSLIQTGALTAWFAKNREDSVA